MSEVELERIKKLESQFEALKEIISKVGNNAQQSVTELKEDVRRVTKSNSDNITQVANITSENGDKINNLLKLILGDGEQDPGLRAEMKIVEKDVSDLKLESRDRLTRNNFVRGAWVGVGTLVVGIGITLFRGVIDEKAANAAKTQADNIQRFTKIEDKVETNNNKFYSSIGELNSHKAMVEESLSWIKDRVKK